MRTTTMTLDPRELPRGEVPLASGRCVFNTGRVLIGANAPPAPVRDQGVHADAVQTILLDHQYDAARYSAITYVGASRTAKLVDALWWAVGVALGGTLIYLWLTS